MDKLKVLLLAGVVALVVASVVTYFRPARETVREIVKELGAVAGPDFDFNYFGVNRVRNFPVRISLTPGTTTPLGVQNPVGASSTLVFGNCRLDTTATTAASRFVFARSTAQNSTSTAVGRLLGTSTLPVAGARGVIIASTSPLDSLDNGDAGHVFGPTDWLVLGDQGHAIGTQVPTGECRAEFLELAPLP